MPHILLDYAKEHGKQTELKTRLFDAYFNERKDISDRQILIQEIQSVCSGLKELNTDEVLARLDNAAFREQVEAEEEHWRNRGVTAVPTVAFDSSRALVGAQPVEQYKQALTELLAT